MDGQDADEPEEQYCHGCGRVLSDFAVDMGYDCCFECDREQNEDYDEHGQPKPRAR